MSIVKYLLRWMRETDIKLTMIIDLFKCIFLLGELLLLWKPMTKIQATLDTVSRWMGDHLCQNVFLLVLEPSPFIKKMPEVLYDTLSAMIMSILLPVIHDLTMYLKLSSSLRFLLHKFFLALNLNCNASSKCWWWILILIKICSIKAYIQTELAYSFYLDYLDKYLRPTSIARTKLRNFQDLKKKTVINVWIKLWFSPLQILLNDKLLQSNDNRDGDKFALDHKIANGENSRDGSTKSCSCWPISGRRRRLRPIRARYEHSPPH